jgi:hypothetical protein
MVNNNSLASTLISYLDRLQLTASRSSSVVQVWSSNPPPGSRSHYTRKHLYFLRSLKGVSHENFVRLQAFRPIDKDLTGDQTMSVIILYFLVEFGQLNCKMPRYHPFAGMEGRIRAEFLPPGKATAASLLACSC